MNKKRLLILLIPLAGCFLTTLVVLWGQFNRCEQLLRTVPSIDVFPGSELLKTEITRTGEDYSVIGSMLGAYEHGRVTSEYTTQADHNEVISFYQQKGECHLEAGTYAICDGEAQPFGSYYISMDTVSSSPGTHFFIQLDWGMCGTEIR